MGQPKYLRVAERLAEEIRNGQWVPGSRIAAHRDLATRFGVTISTVTRAVAEAEQRGLVVARPGSGTFVLGVEGPVPARGGGPVDLRHNDAPRCRPAFRRGWRRRYARSRGTGRVRPCSSRGRSRAPAQRTGLRRVPGSGLRGLEADSADILFLARRAARPPRPASQLLPRLAARVLSEPWIYAGFRRLAARPGSLSSG